MDIRLLELLVCPICKGPLEHRRAPLHTEHALVCHADRLAFPVRDGIPVMLENEARVLDPVEVDVEGTGAEALSPGPSGSDAR